MILQVRRQGLRGGLPDAALSETGFLFSAFLPKTGFCRGSFLQDAFLERL